MTESNNEENITNQSENEDNDFSNGYTQEQLDRVNRTLAHGEYMYYDILGVPRLSKIETVKNSYRRLSLLLHPDKNSAPRAEEAFKVINKANTKLTDPVQKLRYDAIELPLILESQANRQGQGQGYQHASHRSDSQYHQRSYQTFRKRNVFERTDEDFMKFLLLFGIPILILLLYPVFSTFFTSPEDFKLRKSGDFTELRFTSIRRIPFYVKKDFQPESLKEYHELEESVENKYYRLYN